MHKKVSLLILVGMLSACVVNDSIPIQSSNKPKAMNEPLLKDRSLVLPPADDMASDNVSGLSKEPVDVVNKSDEAKETADQKQLDNKSSVKEDDSKSMSDTVNSAVENKSEDVTNTSFSAKGTYKIGNPYLIDGVSYYPHEDYSYSEVGMASWYGPNFHGGKTANGEIFDENKFTAAHRTLPMPSFVKVTNLENGVSLNIKVNDRGPYARDRILDLSSAAAEVLGIKKKGSARVKVEILPQQSKHLKKLALESQNTDIYSPDISYSSASVSKPVVRDDSEMVGSKGDSNYVAPITNIVPSKSAVSSPESGEYFVQVAAYSSYDKAEKLKNRLVSLGTVKIFKAVVKGNVLYKVRLGEFDTKDKAERIRNSVSSMGISGSRVILRENGSFNWNVK